MRKFIWLLAIPFLSYADIRVIGVTPSPEPDHAETTIVFPRNDETKNSTPIGIQIRLEGYPLGTQTEYYRKKEVYNDKQGQTLHVVIDNDPYFELNEAFITSLNDSTDYFVQVLEFDIPYELSEGDHLIRVMPVRSYGECLKDPGAYAATQFNYGSPGETYDLTKPYLTYNEPQGSYKYDPKTPVLLDFYISNVMLSKDGYKVRLTIDNTEQRMLISWIPYYIYGLKEGLHSIRLELLDPQNKKVPGPLNDVTRKIAIE